METLQLQQYDEWIADHLDELVTQYAGQVVAIHQGKIAIIGGSEVDVYREIREAGLEPMPLVFRVPREEDFQSILQADPWSIARHHQRDYLGAEGCLLRGLP